MSEIFLLKGFSDKQITAGQKALEAKGEGLNDLLFVQATKDMMDTNVEKLLTRLDTDGSEEKDSEDTVREGRKVVIMAVATQEKALTVMRAFKSVLDDPGEAAFAMVTQTSLTWTLGYYMDHVSKEHEYMKTNNPADDPDMKKIN